MANISKEMKKEIAYNLKFVFKKSSENKHKIFSCYNKRNIFDNDNL